MWCNTITFSGKRAIVPRTVIIAVTPPCTMTLVHYFFLQKIGISATSSGNTIKVLGEILSVFFVKRQKKVERKSNKFVYMTSPVYQEWGSVENTKTYSTSSCISIANFPSIQLYWTPGLAEYWKYYLFIKRENCVSEKKITSYKLNWRNNRENSWMSNKWKLNTYIYYKQNKCEGLMFDWRYKSSCILIIS